MSNLGKKFLIPFAIILAFFPLLNPLGVFTELRLTSFDTFQALFPRVTLEDDPVIVIDIDDATGLSRAIERIRVDEQETGTI